jgi:uncharacterized membrane protein YeaQ/YmgE (transglycosylase-associated protein family)
MEEWIIFLVIGLAAGWAASRLMGGKADSLFNNLIIGVIGAILGGYLFRRFGIAITGVPQLVNAFIAALVGSILLLLALRFVRKS